MDNMSDRTNLDLHALDKEYVLHPTTHLGLHDQNGPQILTGGSGCFVQDDQGNRLLDGVAGLWCVNAGYGRDELGDVMAVQAKELAYFHMFSSASNAPAIKLAERLVTAAGGRISKAFFGQSGSDANDTLMKIVWAYNYARGKPEKRKIISRQQGYHGVSVASASLTGLPAFHKIFGLPMAEVKHLSCPHYWKYGAEGESEATFTDRLVQEFEALIESEGAETIGAIILEPIQGAGGVIVPPEGYLQRMVQTARANDILVIADEVICGFGRLGRAFGHHFYDFEPDMIAVAKGLTSAYFPMSASMISEDIWQVLRDESSTYGVFAHGYTYSGHPVGAAVANATLDIYEREGLYENADSVGQYLQQAMRQAVGDHPNIAEVRGERMMMAMQIVEDRASKTTFDLSLQKPAAIAARARELGLICRPLPTGDAISFSPPLTLTKGEADFICDRFAQALNEMMA